MLGLATAGAFLTLATIFATGTLRAFNIPASSMEPTLRVGDFVFANMNAFRTRDPDRGDVVALRPPRKREVYFVKRIVGLPGDRIQFVRGILHINDVPVSQKPAGTYTPTTHADEPSKPPQALMLETLPNGRSYLVVASAGGRDSDSALVTVPAGHYFLAGDHRDNSDDSRFGLGLVPRENIEGRFIFIYWSRDRSRIFETVR